MFKYFTLFLIAISLNAHSAVQNNQLPSTVSKYFPCESFGMSPKAGTSQNKTAFQKCLANYSNISITTPGTYKAVWGNIIKSNQTLYIGSGVTLQQASGVIAASFLSNGNYLSKAVTTTYNITHSFVSGISTATLIFSGGVLPINAETGKTVTVGDYVEITQDKSNQYNGVFRLTAVNNTNKAGKLPAWSLQFAANGNGSDAGVDGLRVAAADANITVTGGGTIDGNSSGISGCPTASITTPGGALGGHGIVLNRHENSHFTNLKIINTCNYAFEISNTFNAVFDTLYFNNTKACVQSDGPFSQVEISNFSGSTTDDCVTAIAGVSYGDNTDYSGITSIDSSFPLNGSINQSGVLNTELFSGIGWHIKNVSLISTGIGRFGQADPDLIYGGFSDVTYENIGMTSLEPASSSVSGHSYQLQFNPNVDSGNVVSPGYLKDVYIHNISAISLTSGGSVTIDTLTINNFQSGAPNSSNGMLYPYIATGSSTINNLSLSNSNIYVDTNVGFEPLLSIGGLVKNLSINKLNTNSEGSLMYSWLSLVSGGNIENVNINGGSINGSGGIIADCSNGTSIGVINVSNITYNGQGGISQCGNAATYNLSNLTITSSGAGYLFNIYSGAANNTININANTMSSNIGNFYFVWLNGVSNATINANFNNLNLNASVSLFNDTGSNNIWNLTLNNISKLNNQWANYGKNSIVNTK